MFWNKEFIKLMRETSKEMGDKMDNLTAEVSGIKEKIAEFKVLGDTIEKMEKRLETLEDKVDENTVVVDRVKKEEVDRREITQAVKIQGAISTTNLIIYLCLAGIFGVLGGIFFTRADSPPQVSPQDTIYLVDIDRK